MNEAMLQSVIHSQILILFNVYIIIYKQTQNVQRFPIYLPIMQKNIERKHEIEHKWGRKSITSGSHHIGIVGHQGLRICRYHPLPVKMWTQIYQDPIPTPLLSPCKMKLGAPFPFHLIHQSIHPQCQHLPGIPSWLQVNLNEYVTSS